MASFPPQTDNEELNQWLNEIYREGLGGSTQTGTTTADPNAFTLDTDTGEIDDADGNLFAYRDRYIDVAYGTDAQGSNFSNTIAGLPANTTVIWQGIRNQNTTTQGTSATAFVWRQINNPGNFDNTQLRAYFRVLGARRIDWIYSNMPPAGYVLENGASVIDLDGLLQGNDGPAGVGITAVTRDETTGVVSVQLSNGNVERFNLADGTDGQSTAALTIFRRSPTPPTDPVGGAYSFRTNTFTTVPVDWSATPPLGNDPLYVSMTVATSDSSVGEDNSLFWTNAALFVMNGADGADGRDGIDGTNGRDGVDGTNGRDGTDGATGPQGAYIVQIFVRAATQPATPTDVTWTASTEAITGANTGGWSTSIPSGTDPVWIAQQLFNPMTNTAGTLTSWSETFQSGATGPTGPAGPPGTDGMDGTNGRDGMDGTNGRDGVDGTNGVDGSSLYEANVYQRAATAPAMPTGGQYNFGTNTLTPPNGWFTDIPAGTDPVYRSTALASTVGATGIDTTLTWSTPVMFVQNGADGTNGMDGNDGADGTAGRSTFQAIVYIRSANRPTTPTQNDGSFNFGTQTLAPPSGWSISPPANNGLNLWATTGLFSIAGDTGTDNTVTWSMPQQVAANGQDGMNGADGMNGMDGAAGNVIVTEFLFRRSATQPPAPGTVSYNSNDGSFTVPTNWSRTVPAGTLPVYTSVGRGVGTGTFNITFDTARLLAQNGMDGTNGMDGSDGATGPRASSGVVWLTASATSRPPTPTASAYDFSSGVFSNLTAGWQRFTPSVSALSSTQLNWQSTWIATETTFGGAQTVTFNTPTSVRLFSTDIQSDNYVAGTSGFILERDTGSAEFNNVRVRGDIVANSLDVTNATVMGTLNAGVLNLDGNLLEVVDGRLTLNTAAITAQVAAGLDRPINTIETLDLVNTGPITTPTVVERELFGNTRITDDIRAGNSGSITGAGSYTARITIRGGNLLVLDDIRVSQSGSTGVAANSITVEITVTDGNIIVEDDVRVTNTGSGAGRASLTLNAPNGCILISGRQVGSITLNTAVNNVCAV